MMSAAQFGDESKIVKPLLELLCTRPGANLDAVDVRASTSQSCSPCARGHLGLVVQIVGRTALILSQSAWATQVLIDHGADVNIGTTVRTTRAMLVGVPSCESYSHRW